MGRTGTGVGIGLQKHHGESPIRSWFIDTASTSVGAGDVIISSPPHVTVVGTPRRIVDSVVGGHAVRMKPGDLLKTGANLAKFVATGECTIHVIFRTRANGTGTHPVLIDFTQRGTKKGLQICFGDVVGDINHGRSITVRQWDGTTWTDSAGTAPAPGVWIPQDWSLITVRITATRLDIRCNGQFVWALGYAFDNPFVDLADGEIWIGGGSVDYRGWALFATKREEVANAKYEDELMARFGVLPIRVLAGDPTMQLGGHTGALSAAFPYMSGLLDSRIYATIYKGFDGPDMDDANDSYIFTPEGENPVFFRHETQNTNTLRYADLKTSEPLSDGSIVQTSFTYDQNNKTGSFVIWRRSTDGIATWSAWANADTGATPDQAFVSQAPVEDPTQLGHWHMAVQTFEAPADSPTKGDVWDYKTSDACATWTRLKILDGVADSKAYAEPAMRTTAVGEFRMLIRDATSNGITPMLQTFSAAGNHATAWALPAATNLPAWSPGQQVQMTLGGDDVWIGRELGSSNKAALWWRAAGAAADDPWVSEHVEIDPTWGGMYYAAIREIGPGVILILVAVHSYESAYNLNVRYRKLELWKVKHAMPGSATPRIATVTAGMTQQIALTGAGDYTCVIDSDSTGGAAVVVTGESAVLTAGPDNGSIALHFVDVNGKTTESCTYTVTGAITSPQPAHVFPSAVKAGQAITFRVKGTHFDTGATPVVTINGVVCTSPTTVSGTIVSAVTPVGLTAGGPYDVVVTYASGPNVGSGTLAGSFDVFGASLIAQFDDSSLQNTTSSGKITDALDLTGNGNVLHQLASGNQPVLTASGMNGLPGAAWFNAGLVDSGTTTWGLSTKLSFCTLIQSTNATEQRVFGMQYTNFHGLFYTTQTTQLLGYFTADIVPVTGALVCDGVPHACMAIVDTATAGTAEVEVDGVSSGTIPATAPFVAGNGDHMAWGCAANSDNGVIDHPLNGYSPVMYVFNDAIAGALRTQVRNNLKRRGGIA